MNEDPAGCQRWISWGDIYNQLNVLLGPDPLNSLGFFPTYEALLRVLMLPWILAIFSSITHKKENCSREYSLRKKPTLRQNHIVLQTSLFTINVIWVGYYYIRPELRAIGYRREKDYDHTTGFFKLIFKIMKILFRIFFSCISTLLNGRILI